MIAATGEPEDVAGVVQIEVARRIPAIIRASVVERQRLGRDAIAELRAGGALSDDEAEQLGHLLDGFRDPDRRPLGGDALLARFRAAGAGPVALAIAGVLATGEETIAAIVEQRPTLADGAADIEISTWQEAAAVGALVGGIAGLVIAGPAGGIAGAVAGGVGGAVAFEVAQVLLE